MSTNEAAERLRKMWVMRPVRVALLNDALAAERRATVERIRAEYAQRREAQHTQDHRINYDPCCMDCDDDALLTAILDEEAAR